MSDVNDVNDVNKISAQNTENTDEVANPDAVADPDAPEDTLLYADKADDNYIRTYQDDLHTKESDTDPIIDEASLDPADELQIPVDEYREELDKLDLGDHSESGSEDMRETLEDREEDDDNAASAVQ